MPDDIRPHSPDIQDELWTEQEPATQRADTSGRIVTPVESGSIVPQSPMVESAEQTPSEVERAPGIVSASPFSSAANDTPSQDVGSQYIAVGPDLTKKPHRRKWIIALCIIGGLGLLSAGTALAYNLWYQNPDKVLSDAVMHAVKAKSLAYKGSYVTDMEGGKLTVDFDGNNPSVVDGQLNVNATLAMQGQSFKLSGSGLLAADGTFYFKLSNLRSLLESAAKQYGMPTTMFDGIVAKIDDKWVKVSSDDVKQFSETAANNQKCLTDAFKKLESDKAEQKEISDLYRKHKFITVSKKLGSATVANVQSLGYELTGNTAVLKQFVGELNNTKFAASLKTCDKSFSFDADAITDDNEAKENVRVWVSRWSHNFTRLSVDSTDANNQKTNLWLEPRFNAGTPITPPSDAITIEQLQSDIQSLWSSAEASTADRAAATQTQADATAVLKHVELYNAVEATYPTLTQLKSGTVTEAKLSGDISSRVGSTVPSAANPTAIQYQLCSKATGAYISYFDTSTATVVRLTAGICA